MPTFEYSILTGLCPFRGRLQISIPLEDPSKNCTRSSSGKRVNNLKMERFDTELGPITALADENLLYLLDFADSEKPERKMNYFPSTILPGRNRTIDMIETELRQYFKGKLKTFNTPLFLSATPFQKQVWDALRKIPYGQTISYTTLAAMVGRPKAYRAVAQANGANRFPIIIPCHRVINANGQLGGYSSGISRKQWLIQHEK